jgi:hypothetical protein
MWKDRCTFDHVSSITNNEETRNTRKKQKPLLQVGYMTSLIEICSE